MEVGGPAARDAALLQSREGPPRLSWSGSDPGSGAAGLLRLSVRRPRPRRSRAAPWPRSSRETGVHECDRSAAGTTHAPWRPQASWSPKAADPRRGGERAGGTCQTAPRMRSAQRCRRTTQSLWPETTSSMFWLDSGSPVFTISASRIQGLVSSTGSALRRARRKYSASDRPRREASRFAARYSSCGRLICVRITITTYSPLLSIASTSGTA